MDFATLPGRAAASALSARDARRPWIPLSLLIITGIELLLLYAPTMAWLFDRWTMSVWHNAHGFLIPPVVAWFSWQELRRRPAVHASASAAGFLFLVPALAILVLDAGIHTQILSAISLVIALPGLALLFLGIERTRLIAFPLAFTAFMLPLPLAFTERIHYVLREIGTFAAAQIVPWFGITVHAQSTALHIREGILMIGDGCSGFSTLYAACAVAVLAAYSCDTTRGRVLALVAAAPLAVAANVVRIVLLVLLVRWRGMEALGTWLHPASGVLTFALSIPVILWLARPRRSEAPA